MKAGARLILWLRICTLLPYLKREQLPLRGKNSLESGLATPGVRTGFLEG